METIAVKNISRARRDILVVACSASNDDGMFGDLLATSAMAHGVVGLIIDAGCRDIKELRAMGFPVWSKIISAKGTVKETLGSVNMPIKCAGQLINPGDIVLADDDGVVCVPREKSSQVLIKTELREELEKSKREKLLRGESTLDTNNMRLAIKSAGLKYVENPSELRLDNNDN